MRYLHATPAHIVYRLRGSLPAAEVNRLREGYYRSLTQLRKNYGQDDGRVPVPDYPTFQREKRLIDRVHFRQYDQLLDECSAGPRFLDQLPFKRLILDSWAYFHHQRTVTVHAVSVMGNHVHVVLSNPHPEPLELDSFLAHHKRFVATHINRRRDRRGERVFAEHNYVRQVRPGVLDRVIRYVVNNPVAAGLTATPLTWPGTFVLPCYLPLFDSRAA